MSESDEITAMADDWIHFAETRYEGQNMNLNEKAEALDMILKLTEEEGCTLTIVHPNPEYWGSEQVIYYTPGLLEDEQRIDGKSLMDCLEQAIQYQEADKCPDCNKGNFKCPTCGRTVF